uniref:Uncharacterized protein n=1 Tax=Acanthochromis polyacanthus TaxID=80966 RepID=A0A3Q1FDB9_9TELE
MGNTFRQCAIQINNNSNNCMLQNPMVYLYSGRCENTLPSTIGPSEEGSALFTKTSNTACGSVGVFTYELYNQSTKTVEKKMAVMFSDPFNFAQYSNYYAVGLFDKTQLCEYNLYHKMYYNTGTEFVRCHAGYPLTYKGDGLIISASMTDTYDCGLGLDLVVDLWIVLSLDLDLVLQFILD